MKRIGSFAKITNRTKTLTGHLHQAVVLGGLLSAGACAPTEEIADETSQEIISGTKTATDRPEVVLLETTFGQDCTATLISARTFVTAAHCVNYKEFAPGGNLKHVTLGDLPVADTYSFGNDLGDRDIAVGRLQAPVPTGTALGRIAYSLPSQTEITAVGYGCTESRAKNCKAVDRMFRSYFFDASKSDWRNTTDFLAPGDSGGPHFIGGLADGGAIVRITSGYFENSGTDFYGDAVRYRDDIEAMSDALQTQTVGYRAHMQDHGWMRAKINGATAGAIGEGRRVEAVQIWSNRPGLSICYQPYVQDHGWRPPECNGKAAGSTGEHRRLQAVKVWLQSFPPDVTNIEYRVYLQNVGWTPWRRGAEIAGTLDQPLRIEAIEVRLV